MTNELHNRFINATNNPTGVDVNVIYISPTAYPSTVLSANSGLVTVDTTAGGIEIVPTNTDRFYLEIINQGQTPVLINFDDDVSAIDYRVILPPASGVRVGDGGSYTIRADIQNFKGQIKGITETGSSVISIIELEVSS